MKILKYNIENLKDITSMVDFYERVGLAYRDDENQLKLIITDVRQIFMDKANCMMLNTYLKSNQKLQKDRRLKTMSKKVL